MFNQSQQQKLLQQQYQKQSPIMHPHSIVFTGRFMWRLSNDSMNCSVFLTLTVFIIKIYCNMVIKTINVLNMNTFHLVTTEQQKFLYLHKLWEILKEFLIINCELVVFVFDSVMLNFSLVANTQCVVAGEVSRLSHQKQAIFLGWEETLCPITRYFPMKPTANNHVLTF